MKPAISSALILAFVALCGLDASPQPKQEVYVAEAAAKSPLCDCSPCKCDPCECSPVASPLVVGPPPESLTTLKGGEVQTVQFTQPQPVAKPKLHETTRSPANAQAIARPQSTSYGSCGPGGCGQRRGLFGRRR
jgi:hypothetical protein